MNNLNTFADTRTIGQKIFGKLGFGICADPEMPDEEYPDMAPSRMSIINEIHIDWKDMLRLIISRKLYVATSMKTDCIIKKSISKTKVSVMRP